MSRIVAWSLNVSAGGSAFDCSISPMLDTCRRANGVPAMDRFLLSLRRTI
jgi:hypothetical protein